MRQSAGSFSGMDYTVQHKVARAVIVPVLAAGLWIRIDLIRIRIQHFCSIRILIQAKTEQERMHSEQGSGPRVCIYIVSTMKWSYSMQ
jgi:hypothetical protein